MLYRKINFSKDAKTTQMPFLTTILSQKRLAFLVEEYHLPSNTLENLKSWYLVRHGLQAMVNFKRLFVQTSRGSPSGNILLGCTFQLEFLQWSSNDVKEPETSEFLASQPRLRALSLRC